jgi:heme-degrading monooxygenase HmoA
MYGTVARMKVKPGEEERVLAMARAEERLGIPGFVGEFIYRLDGDKNEYLLVVLFADKESYFANSDSREQDTRYRRMRALLDGEPEWSDGEIVHARMMDSRNLAGLRAVHVQQ